MSSQLGGRRCGARVISPKNEGDNVLSIQSLFLIIFLVYSLKIVCVCMMYSDHICHPPISPPTLPGSTPSHFPPNFMSSFKCIYLLTYLLFNSLSPISIAHMSMAVESCPGHGQSTSKHSSSPKSYQLPIAHRVKEIVLLPCWNFHLA